MAKERSKSMKDIAKQAVRIGRLADEMLKSGAQRYEVLQSRNNRVIETMRRYNRNIASNYPMGVNMDGYVKAFPRSVYMSGVKRASGSKG